ncbi:MULTISPECIES: UDP-glucose 4-epimerase GalE [Cycloclasticus]|jgi:UDP-glucose 4-epimerase|uniref:UDP-glucose 4-epimerase GalE n=1 Tax=Cycloclasticus TaxID=34067 RepID=UPI000286AD6C|nr:MULTISPECIES: UDP-glucose 4-epimerase GalE [Cycloclasticus]AFT67536.1 UDP-glucose 4-epimerase [Cycloclasticus sp. P1]SHI45521.1 UDP-galactose 4-epimerase [Cycloclasticus pugetii]|tara:strand:+ start:1049 stop:2041 length:993 start_codon:yes stop_codon:yes gene_type:complete
MTAKSILVTGGAGYIGSHVVKLLGERGENIIILDDLSTGFEHSILYGKFIQGNTGDKKLVDRILQQHNIDSVLHFAAHTIVPESVENPLKYYENNTCCTRNLLECCSKAGIKNIIFSSTAAVYGELETGFASEETPTAPINPYGSSKLMSEQMIRDLSKATELNHVILRYFNVAGSDPDGKIGQSTKNATLLIKVAAEVAVGKREKLFVFGTDYPTPDGTGIRDYIHVSDLAEAHINALDYLRNNGESTTLNCGYGHGFSVKEVINAINEEHGVPICVEEMPRRAGDPPELISVAEKIRQTIGWQPQYDDLNLIVKTSLAWEKKLITHGS